jgi:toxin ParE1/3/4
MRLRYADSALADLDAIHEYQAAHWPTARAAFEARLTAVEKRILQFPHGGPEVAERPGVRVVAFIDFPYRLFYRVNDETIEVLAIRHTSRRPPFE